MLSKNRTIIAAAGSGKTTKIIEECLSNENKKILVVTFTVENYKEIKKKFTRQYGCIPPNVKLMTWFTFLLQECARPYQNFVYDKRIENIMFVSGQSARFIKKTNINKYYFDQGRYIFTDKLSDFVCLCNEKSNGLVIERLEKMYDIIYVDEVQDLAGYDYEFLYDLMKSNICINLIGDNRQSVYFTNASRKNKKIRGRNCVELFQYWKSMGICELESLNICYRSNQSICDLADMLYPEMPKTISKNVDSTGHDGVFRVKEKDIEEYIRNFSPQILTYNKTGALENYSSMNFGMSKGLTFDRTLIITTGPIRKFLKLGDIMEVDKSKEKLYVAITRARHSVAFLYDGNLNIKGIQEYK